MVGQSVHERLVLIHYPMRARHWTADEMAELRRLADHETISDIALRLGRPYAGVAIKLSRLGIGSRFGNRIRTSRSAGISPSRLAMLRRYLDSYNGSLRSFALREGVNLERMVATLQSAYPEWWSSWVEEHATMPARTCDGCGISFRPLSAKQRFCTKSCAYTTHADRTYFGGRRGETVGLAEGICQLCLQETRIGLSSHHLLGKEHDPENRNLVALCRGCHQIVTLLSGRDWADSEERWEALINLVVLRRQGWQDGVAASYATVEIELLRPDQIPEAV